MSSSSSWLEVVVYNPTSLESQCISAYLRRLESFCSGYVQLKARKSRSSRFAGPMLERVKRELSLSLSGTASTNLREAMIRRVLNEGEFPSKVYQNQFVRRDLTGVNQTVVGDNIKKFRKITAAASRGCESLCCTGYFIVETMLSVLVNVDVKNLRFDNHSFGCNWTNKKIFKNKEVLPKYVRFQLPAVLAHYAKSVEGSDSVPKLERLIIQCTNIQSRSLALRQNTFPVIAAFKETQKYLDFPNGFSKDANGEQYGAYSEYLMLVTGELFSSSPFNGVGCIFARFPYLTEILFSRELVDTSLSMANDADRNVATDLFWNIGRACPNLRVLDLSGGITLSTNCLLFMLFHDAYAVLHRYAFLPEHLVHPISGNIVQNDLCEPSQVRAHHLGTYCPWCQDPWCSNVLRQGAEFSEINTPILDDRVYQKVLEEHPEMGKFYLMNVVRATDLVKAVDGPMYSLVRPKGPAPYSPDFDRSRHPDSGLKDYDFYWKEPDKVDYQAVDPDTTPIMNPICQSLEILKLNLDVGWPKEEIVPFLFKALPNVKCLGEINVLRGLRMMEAIPELRFIPTEKMEQLEFGTGSNYFSHCNGWADNAISDLLDDSQGELFGYGDTAEERREIIMEEVEVAVQKCPNLTTAKFCLRGDDQYIMEDDDFLWGPLLLLDHLVDATIYAHSWDESVALVRTLSPNLKKLYLSFDGRGAITGVEVTPLFPCIEDVLELCPSLEKLTVSFGLHGFQSRSAEEEETVEEESELKFPNMKEINVHTFIIKPALDYIWKRCKNLKSLSFRHVVPNNEIPHNFDCVLDTPETTRFLSLNPTLVLESLRTLITFDGIIPAKLFVTRLAETGCCKTMGRFLIHVGVVKEHQEPHEAFLVRLSELISEMTKFKKFIAGLKVHGITVNWGWEKVGVLQQIALEIQDDVQNLEP